MLMEFLALKKGLFFRYILSIHIFTFGVQLLVTRKFLTLNVGVEVLVLKKFFLVKI